MDSDTNITEQIRRGDVEAFSSLFRSFYEPLCFFAQRFLNDFDGAEGVVQDVFVRLWDGRESLTIHTSLRSYLYTAVKNGCLNHLKHARYSLPIDGAGERFDDGRPRPDAQLESDETMKALEAAIENLPPKCRDIFRLARFDGLSYQEIAEIQNVSVNTVKTQLQRALKSLSKALHYLQVLLLLMGVSKPVSTQTAPVTLCDDSVVVTVGESSQREQR